jgi:ABC-type nickel/cobalt efflux system permease component RcnA
VAPRTGILYDGARYLELLERNLAELWEQENVPVLITHFGVLNCWNSCRNQRNEKEALFKEKSKVGEKEERRGKSEAEMKYLSSRREPCCCSWKAPLPTCHSTWAVAKEEVYTARTFRVPLQYQEWPAPKCSVIIGNK